HVRYMDDLLLFHSDRDVLFAKEWEIARFVENYLHQELKFEATQKGPCRVGVPWLGFRVWPRQIRLDAARKRRFLRALRYVREPDRLASRVAWVAQADTRGLRRCALAKLPMPG
ncbi:MAG TPA: RNA-dependent DNA polymerase, partial [Myxococcota bacterium]|nr:RNA-dependent DNA polymerase [Myxococcota bacterium]